MEEAVFFHQESGAAEAVRTAARGYRFIDLFIRAFSPPPLLARRASSFYGVAFFFFLSFLFFRFFILLIHLRAPSSSTLTATIAVTLAVTLPQLQGPPAAVKSDLPLCLHTAPPVPPARAFKRRYDTIAPPDLLAAIPPRPPSFARPITTYVVPIKLPPNRCTPVASVATVGSCGSSVLLRMLIDDARSSLHGGGVVRQPKDPARAQRGEETGRVEREEVDASSATATTWGNLDAWVGGTHIRSDVHRLGKKQVGALDGAWW